MAKQFSQEQLKNAIEQLDPKIRNDINETSRKIGKNSWASVNAAIELIDLIWDYMEKARDELAPEDRPKNWVRHEPQKTFALNGCRKMNLLWLKIMAIRSVPLIDDLGLKVSEGQLEDWNRLAKHSKKMREIKPASFKSARDLCPAFRSGKEINTKTLGIRVDGDAAIPNLGSLNLVKFDYSEIEEAGRELVRIKQETIADLFRKIGAKGWSAIVARIELINVIWDAMEDLRDRVVPKESHPTCWYRYDFDKTFQVKNLEKCYLRKKDWIKLMTLWQVPLLDNEGMRIDSITYRQWHDLAKFSDVLELYKPATIKDAVKVIAATRMGNEDFFKNIKYCIDDAPEISIETIKEAVGGRWGYTKGLKPRGNKPSPESALRNFALYAAKCLELGSTVKELQDLISDISQESQ